MTRWLAVGAALISITSVSLLLLWGTSGGAGTPSFEAAVTILGVAAPLASLLLTWHLWRDRRHAGALLSSSPILVMLVVATFAVSGRTPSLGVLLWLDAVVLVVFVVVLGWFGRGLLRLSPPPVEESPASRRHPAAYRL